MKNRSKVYIQVKNQATGRWNNYKAANTYDEAIEEMGNLQNKFPNAILRVLDNNLVTHTG